MPKWTFCRTCGERMQGEFIKCEDCDSSNIHVVEIVERTDDGGATVFPDDTEWLNV